MGGGVASGGKIPMMPLGHELGAGVVAQYPSRTLRSSFGLRTCSPPKFQKPEGSGTGLDALGGIEALGSGDGSSGGLADGTSPDGVGAEGLGSGDGGSVAPGARLGGCPSGVGDGCASGGRTG